MSQSESLRVAYFIFETTFGHACLIWNEIGLSRVLFPRKSLRSLQLELQNGFPNAKPSLKPPIWVKKIGAHIEDLLAGGDGKIDHWDETPIDLTAVPSFHARVYREALKIQRGHFMSYQALAVKAGSPKAARAVGQAMARNPMPLVVPCHRVMAANGQIGGFTAPGGLGSKYRLLEMEGISVKSR